MSDNVDVISSIIAEQSRDFLQADSKFNEDVKFMEEGLKKVEFARSQNYLSELAVYVQKQEKENLALKLALQGKYFTDNFFRLRADQEGKSVHENPNFQVAAPTRPNFKN